MFAVLCFSGADFVSVFLRPSICVLLCFLGVGCLAVLLVVSPATLLLLFRRRFVFLVVVVVVAPAMLFSGGFGAAVVRFNGGGRCSDDVIGVIRCSGDGPVVLELRWWLWVEVMRCVGVGSVGFLGFWCWI
jgi:hypothetical protein